MEDEMDGYGYIFHTNSKVVQGNFLELVPRGEDTYYVDKKKAYVNAACILGIAPDLLQYKRSVRGKKQTVHTVTPEIHEIILVLATRMYI